MTQQSWAYALKKTLIQKDLCVCVCVCVCVRQCSLEHSLQHSDMETTYRCPSTDEWIKVLCVYAHNGVFTQP